ncbi:pectate lyase [Stemphylium lycopersici]|uniref:Probable pectate lyase F n=1 Tax=Stemphylium lycopersici TaxID=183478 RepID=A0A364N9I5_STELY|nr:pectate lyase [Stemphylium lycopersici]RAR13671.1 pectate lyase [Stemphylium lycopersici]
MRFSLATVATAALFLSASAAPARSGHGHGRSKGLSGSDCNGTESAGPNGSGPSSDGEHAGGPPGMFPSGGSAAPTGGFPGSGVQPSGLPQMTAAPTALPDYPDYDSDVSSVSFEFPASKRQVLNWKVKARKSKRDEDDEDSDSKDDSSDSSDSSDDKKDESGDDSESDSKDDSSDSSDSNDESSGSGDEEQDSSDSSSGSDSSDSSSGSNSGSGSSNSTVPSSGSSPSSSSGGNTTASGTFPEAAGESTLSETMMVTGEFDGGMKRFGRGVSCTGQEEGGDSDAVFSIADGGTLRNAIIGADQIEGVHCQGACTIENVWWEAVCEDALTFKKDGDGTVTGGGAKGASDKVIQHNGLGTISISGFSVSDFGKLYRSCGNCDTMGERHVKLDGIKASGGKATFVGINSNYGDTATITNSCVTGTKTICEEFEGNDTGAEPKSISEGSSSACIYTDADINAC